MGTYTLRPLGHLLFTRNLPEQVRPWGRATYRRFLCSQLAAPLVDSAALLLPRTRVRVTGDRCGARQEEWSLFVLLCTLVIVCFVWGGTVRVAIVAAFALLACRDSVLRPRARVIKLQLTNDKNDHCGLFRRRCL